MKFLHTISQSGHRNRLLLASVSAAVMLAGVTAGAQTAAAQAEAEDSSIGIEEIVVTSRKRGVEFVQDIPTAITVLSEETLTKMGVFDFEDFAYQVPGLTFNDGGPGEKRYIIRGVSSAGQQQVAVYYDEVPLPGVQSSTSDSGSQTTDLKIFDVQRIEVLKGPQGTTFGANSQTGTVRFIMNKPNLVEFEGNFRGEASKTHFGDENWSANAMVNLPIVEGKLAARLVAYSGEDSGYIDNVRLGQKNINWTETTGVRGMLRWVPSETVTVDAMAWYQDRDNGGDARFHPFDSFQQRGDASDIGFGDSPPASTFFQTGDLKVGDYTQTPKPDNQTIYSVTVNWELPFADLTATGSIYDRDFFFKFDSTWIILFLGAEGVRDDLFPALTDQQQSLNQKHFEVRLNSNHEGRVQWLGGFFFQDRESKFRSFVPVTDPITGLTFDPGTPFTGPSKVPGAGIEDCHPCVFARVANKDIEQIALFGEVSYAVTDKIELTAGLRWFQVDQSDFGATVFQFALFSDFIPPANTQSVSENRLIKKFAINWQATDDANFYVSASQGFRLGGTNNRGVVDIPALFESDSLWNYEIGAKTSWFDNRAILNVATFFIDWKNLQVAGQDPTGAFGFIGNAGAAEVIGLEVELFAKPTPALDVTFGLSWLPKKELSEDQVSTEVIAPGKKGDQIARIPEVTLNATGQYNFEVMDGWGGYLRAEVIHKGKSRTELRFGSANDRPQRSFEIVNLRTGFHSDELDGEIVFFAENIFDVRADVFIGTASAQPTNKITTRPRTMGVQLNKRF